MTVYAEPGSAGPVALEMLELWRELIDLHDRVNAAHEGDWQPAAKSSSGGLRVLPDLRGENCLLRITRLAGILAPG